MANTLTNLIPDAYRALDVISRELVGFIPAVLRDSAADQVPINGTVRSFVVPANTAAGDITPAMSFPAAADQTIGNVPITITKQRFAPFSWTGAEQKAINAGPGYQNVKTAQIAQAMRTLVNEIELDLANLATVNASRAFGTAGTTPFGTAGNYTAASNLHKILVDNGSALTDKQLVINTTTGANLRGLQATAQNATTDDILRRGVLLDINGFPIRESGQLGQSQFTKGAGTGALINGTPAVGATTIPYDTLTVNTTGIKAGDIITIAGDTNRYVVVTGTTATSGNIVIAAPGLRVAPSDNAAITVGDSYTPSGVAFDRNAFILVTRVPDVPAEGDLAIMREVITDPISGLSFEIAAYPGQRMITYQVAAAWGVKALKPEHSALLIG